MIESKSKKCSFFGHRNIEATDELNRKVKEVVEDLIVNHNVCNFLFGSRSNFDALCHSVVTDLKEKYKHINRIVYTCKNETCILEKEIQMWEKIYSNLQNEPVRLIGFDLEIEHKTKYSSGKAGYVERNYAMIDDSDFCVFYYDEQYIPKIRQKYKKSLFCYHPKSGTALAYNYAKQKKKAIINLI